MTNVTVWLLSLTVAPLRPAIFNLSINLSLTLQSVLQPTLLRSMESTTVQVNMRVQTQQQPLTQYDAERQNLIEKTWIACLIQISNGSPSVTISNEVFTRFGQDGLDAIMSRYRYTPACEVAHERCVCLFLNSAVIHAEVIASHSAPEGRITLFASYLAAPSNASPPTTSDNAQVGRNVRRAKNKIARPPNAFILYRQHHHPKVKAMMPEMHNNDICK